ncbi:MAG: MATE family efflux transporter [Myxococcales bacterium]|nr:MATE family efflux transporter [Myxococcales bacterium]
MPHGAATVASDARASIPARLLRLALPVVGLNVLNVLSPAVDTAMCGRLPHADVALTALGFAAQIVFLMLVAMIGLSVGAVALVSRAYGAEDHARVNHVLQQSIELTVLVALLVATLGNALAGPLMRVLGAEGSALDVATSYLGPMLALSVFYYLNVLLASVLRGVGNTWLPFVTALISNALNVVLNYGLIFGKLGLPALGVPGAAWGTVVSQAVGLAILVATIRRGRVPGLFIPLRPHGLDRSVAKELLQVGAPAAADLFIFNAGFLSIVGMLGRIDPVAVAAHGVGLRIQSLAFVPGLGISQAMGAMVGNALGARDIAEAKAVFSAGLRLSTGAMTAIGFGLVAGAAPLLAVFHVAGGTTLGALSTTWMRILGLSMPIVGVYVGIMGVFRGSGDTTTSLRVNVVGTACLIPLSYLLGFPLGLGAFGVWLAFPLSFVIKAVYGLFEYRRDRWARVGVALQA